MSSKLPEGWSEYLATDDLTILLGLIGATVFLLHNLYKPQPLVHPILLGRQSDASRVRHPGESAVYRNYATGLLGRFPLRPDKDISLLDHLVRSSLDSPRTLWSTKLTNPQLKARAAAFGTGIQRLAGLKSGESNVLVLLNDCIEFVISDLALSAHSIPTFTLSSTDLLASVLDSHPPSAIITHAFFLPQLLELVYDANEHTHHTFIIVGDPKELPPSVPGKINLFGWSDIEAEGTLGEAIVSPTPGPSDVFSVSFYRSEVGEVRGVQLTHENLTAGVAAVKSLFPPSSGITTLDTVISSHGLCTPYGRALAYTAIFEGASFATLDSTKLFSVDEATRKADLADIKSATKYPIPPATLLFGKPGHLSALTSAILGQSKKSYLYSLAFRHKTAAMADGFVARDSLWDRLVFDKVRADVMGDCAGTLRGIVISGGRLSASEIAPARIALSIPIVNLYNHPTVSAPVFATHPLDVQTFPYKSDDEPFHVGPAGVNVEAKIVGVDDESVESGANPEGALFVRGPSVCSVFGHANEASEGDNEGWVQVAARAQVLSNGTFKVL